MLRIKINQHTADYGAAGCADSTRNCVCKSASCVGSAGFRPERDDLRPQHAGSGTTELAASFCGFDQELTDAALKWAEEHGYKIVMHSRVIDVWYDAVPEDQQP